MLAALTPAARRYLKAFNLRAIARTRDGRLIVTRDPAECAEAWWCARQHAGKVAKGARADHLDVEAAAQRLGLTVTAHDIVLQRVAYSTTRLDQLLERAQHDGLLSFFNTEYARRRKAAAGEGKGFMLYSVAKRRLTDAIVECAAHGAVPTRALVASVFD